FVQNAVKHYDRIKDIIWHGDLYRLSDPKDEDVASLVYVNEERSSGVMFNYLVNNRYDTGSKLPIVLKELDPARKYRVKEINLYPGAQIIIDEQACYSGDFLMTIEFNPPVKSDRKCVILLIEEGNKEIMLTER